MSTRVPEAPISSKAVHDHERRVRLGKQPDDPLVGLALSGGGIRSATFGLGVLQALKRLGLFESLDYVSTVSGGGYIGGWLQAALANKVGAAVLDFPYREPREVRFLRGFSNYLTPRLGLFSGDTWAAVGVSLRNLVLNFTILSLSLAVPLFLPWLLALLFWVVVAWHGAAGALSSAGVVVAVAALLSLTTQAGTANMARPLASGGWTKSGASATRAVRVYTAAVLPPVVAIGLASPLVWAQGTGASQVVGDLAFVGLGGGAYAGAWLVGLVVGYVGGRPGRAMASANLGVNEPPAPVALDSDAVPVPPRATPPPGDAVGRAVWAGLVLVWTAFWAGMLGTAVWLFGGRVLLGWIAGSEYAWRLALLLVPAGVGSLFLCVTVHLGLAGRFMSEETREWWGRVGGVQLLVALLIAVVGAISLGGPHLPDYLADNSDWFKAHQTAIWSVVGAAWAALTGAGVAAGRSDRTADGGGTGVLEWLGRIAPGAFVVGYLLILSGIIRRVVYLPLSSFSLVGLEDTLIAFATVAWAPDALATQAPMLTTGWFDVGALTGLALLTACAAFWVSWVVDLNQFSLHMFYRNRLVRCFLGAPREERHANPFTGFDSADDLPLTDTVKMGLARPYPIFNTALNLVGGQNLAWQQRKAASFIFTPDHCGFEYRTDEQGSEHETRLSAYALTGEHAGDPHSLTVGLAVATSGAAASPNMGYHSSPTLSFLMTVFNVRLGWWLRNPVDRAVWRDADQRLSLRELMYELLGLTTDTRKWVYLSDGGHFENLGIYELVRRRCRYIIACDAGQDGAVTFGDLGNAIEKCRADFGVDIEINVSKIRPAPGNKVSEWHCAIGRIRYDRQGYDEVAGTLLYIKSSLTGDEPADVQRYAAENLAFPHQPTSDQFFDESQFESYRALGFHVSLEVFGPAIGVGIADGVAQSSDGTLAVQQSSIDAVELFTRLGQVWARPAPAPPDAVQRYSEALNRIWTTVRTTPALRFLDEQIFPALPSLLGLPFDLAPEMGMAQGAAGRRLTLNYWLPPSDEERREGFYLCTEMLQLMEDVFLELDLDQYHDHIDNRGWMNLFQHWAWSGMLCATWAITGSTFDPRFQRFCRIRLALHPGRPGLVNLEEALTLPTGDAWRDKTPEARVREKAEWQRLGRLNFWEVELLAKYLLATKHPDPLKLYPILVTVESPRRSDGNPLQFNVGYIVGDVVRADGRGPVYSLHFMRVQNHLRKMGLARDALKAIQDVESMEIQIMPPNFDTSVADGLQSDEGLPLPNSVRYLERLVRSLPRITPSSARPR